METYTYCETFEYAGAKVLASWEDFDDYPGDCVAFVEYEGRKGFVFWTVGCCGWCDDLESSYLANQEEAADFGRGYLNEMQSSDEARTSIHLAPAARLFVEQCCEDYDSSL